VIREKSGKIGKVRKKVRENVFLHARNLANWFSGKSLKLLPPDVDYKAKMHQIRFRLGLHPRPRWGAHSTLPDPLAGFKWAYF